MELLTDMKWLIYRKMPNISKTTFVIIFFMFIPYIPLLIVTESIATPISLAEYRILTESAMMMGIILLIISATVMWLYGKFFWRKL